MIYNKLKNNSSFKWNIDQIVKLLIRDLKRVSLNLIGIFLLVEWGTGRRPALISAATGERRVRVSISLPPSSDQPSRRPGDDQTVATPSFLIFWPPNPGEKEKKTTSSSSSLFPVSLKAKLIDGLQVFSLLMTCFLHKFSIYKSTRWDLMRVLMCFNGLIAASLCLSPPGGTCDTLHWRTDNGLNLMRDKCKWFPVDRRGSLCPVSPDEDDHLALSWPVAHLSPPSWCLCSSFDERNSSSGAGPRGRSKCSGLAVCSSTCSLGLRLSINILIRSIIHFSIRFHSFKFPIISQHLNDIRKKLISDLNKK